MSLEKTPTSQLEIPVSLIRQHVFCPRIPYFILLLDREWVKPLWVSQGQNYQEKRELLLKKRLLTGFACDTQIRFNVSVYSAKWGIYGVVDCILETAEEIIPVEIKMNANHPQRGHILQLTGYSLCLTTAEKPVKRFLILTGKRLNRHEFAFTETLVNEFEKELMTIRKNLERPFPPYSSAPVAKCAQCEYQIQCQDRDL